MDSFSVNKLKEISSYLQALLMAVGYIGQNGQINSTTIYDAVTLLTTSNSARTVDINGSLPEQIKALNDTLNKINDTLSAMNNNLTRQTTALEKLDDSVGHWNGVGYFRTMLPDNQIWFP